MGDLVTEQQFNEIMLPLVREVGGYQKAKLNASHDIEFKGEINIVTEVDKKSEEMIIACLEQHFPKHDIMAEEGSGDRKDSAYKWIVDPLDGTVNYAHGYPHFAVSIALEHNGQILAGVVYDPMRDELFRAYKGGGAFLNDRPIKQSATKELNHSLMATGFAYNLRTSKENNTNHFKNMLMHAQGVRRDGTASLDICYVACGRFDGFWELNLFPWDTAAALLVALEAGCVSSKFDGSEFNVYEKDILVANANIHKDVVKVLKKGLKKNLF